MIIKAPAKLNLYLKVLGKRPDGYHEILSIMVPINIYDEIQIQKYNRSGIKLECNDPSLPINEKNLAFKAAKIYLSKAGVKDGIYIKLLKNIPIAAGLGGGSSDAAAVLKGLNIIYKKLSKNELIELAIELGADVPFFFQERPCIAKGIGEILEPLPPRKLYFVIVTPPIHVSTAWVYNQFKLDLTKSEQSSIKDLWEKGEIENLLKNDLEKVTIKHFSVIKKIKELLIKIGAKGVLMSGSGPSVFGIFDSEKEAWKATKHIPIDIGKIFVASSLNNRYWGVAKR